MAKKTNERVVRELVEALWAGRVDEANGHPGYWPTLHTFGLLRDAFPDLTVAVQRQLRQGDVVVSVLELGGTHANAFLGTPGTGRTLAWTVVYVDTVTDGSVVAHVSGDGWMDMLMGIGALVPPGGEGQDPDSEDQGAG